MHGQDLVNGSPLMPPVRIPPCLAATLVVCLIGCGGGDTGNSTDRARGDVLVLAATSTRDSLAEVAADFERKTGIRVTISAAGSNALATQILNGAPGDIFLSANREWADAVRENGHTLDVRPLLTNELVLVVPRGNPAGVQSPEDLLSDRVAKVALAGVNVPAGQYAGQALDAAGVLAPLTDGGRIVRGQDVRVTLSYVERGEAEAGVVYRTDARLTDGVEVVHAFPADAHDEIIYPAVLLKEGDENAAAREFYDYLFSPEAETVFRKHGFARAGAERE